ncbi:TPA: hypothetical protein ACHJ3Y_005460 [Escherichia coli]|uniref:hypothetical protein n=1 Tax=Escherichia coli TaxID=562 RepID=UPI001807E8A2|nr:hypothetical protein [Escherichia coli]EFJ9750462.1 hypothetical protein [Escherichia coli]MBF5608691.1 hypothetical protein [Escherichia coli]MBL6191646.1 hypothetical protein [Escherichia coli]HAU8815672.1 hypothetical protein [Escherichia coli]HBB8080263.1 hypothetical protein [Escherichia coli]
MRDIYIETIDRAFSALAYAEGMYEILQMWLETFGDNESDVKKARIIKSLITILKPVITELQEIDLLHDRYNEQHTGE